MIVNLLRKKKDVVADLKKIINAKNVLDHDDELRPFETDALSAYKQKTIGRCVSGKSKEVSNILSYCNQKKN